MKTESEDSGSLYDHDRAVLEKLGYKQSLDRSLSAFSTFGITFSCLSILSGLTPLYGDALQSGGPVTVIWGWLVVSMFTLLVGLSLAEICSAYPTTGGLYFWTIKILEGRVINGVKVGSPDWVPLASWIVGYTNWLGLVAIASTDLAMAQFLASMISMTSGYDANTYVIFAIYVGIIILHGIVNSSAVRLNGLFNIVSVWWHVFGTMLIVVVLLVTTSEKQSAEFVFTSWQNNTGWSSGFYVFMLGLLQSQYTLSGYDSAAHMSEETKNAQQGGPWGIIRAILTASAVGWFFLVGVTFCITSFENQIVNPAVGVALSQIFLDSAGKTWAIVLILVILGAQFFCGSALTLSSSRMVYAFARDGALPLSEYLHRLNKEKSPVAAVWFNILFCFVLGLPYIWSETAYSAIVSVNTIASSISYLIPILCRIVLARHTFVPGPFNLGKFSVPVGIVSTLWIVITSVLFLCPTLAPVTAENMNYAAVPFVLVIGLCALYYALWGRKWFKPGGTRFQEDNSDLEEAQAVPHTSQMQEVDEKSITASQEEYVGHPADEYR
ncbi:amino acid transporter [Lobosporangium transversale]|uniref:Amino acid transporter n=1 Tax=Lobosporangium transversale TaxID=64571 RepID=A0A1Y2GJ35_9FUNG|nr:amino acid transporter [Lobosporangium transversale]ORZ12458.1 amino acid transporter [Lobosporangium transversale]|eukprot:XP_021880077.1 amino acid transporter [Lobosporangium transversale]